MTEPGSPMGDALRELEKAKAEAITTAYGYVRLATMPSTPGIPMVNAQLAMFYQAEACRLGVEIRDLEERLYGTGTQ